MNFALQTIIPIPMPMGDSGPVGPWTEYDTKILITINLVLLFSWSITIFFNWLLTRNKRKGSYIEQTLFTFLIPGDHWDEWILTAFLSILFYSVLILESLFGLGYLIYNLIF